MEHGLLVDHPAMGECEAQETRNVLCPHVICFQGVVCI